MSFCFVMHFYLGNPFQSSTLYTYNIFHVTFSGYITGAPETMDVSGPSIQEPASEPGQSASASRKRGAAGAGHEGVAVEKEGVRLGKQSATSGVVDAALGVGGTGVVNVDGGKWLKFNDINVSMVAWEDVEKESFGDSRNTSAYCLIYVADDGSWAEQGEVLLVSDVTVACKLVIAF